MLMWAAAPLLSRCTLIRNSSLQQRWPGPMVCRWGDPEHHRFACGNCDPRWSPSPGPTQPQPFGPQICAASSSLGNQLHEAVDWKGQAQLLKRYCSYCGHCTPAGFSGSRARPYRTVLWTFCSCFLTCVAVLTVLLVPMRETGSRWMEGSILR